MIKHIKTTEEFYREIKTGKVIIDFFATWCGPCRMLAPIIDELSEELPEVTFLKIDVDELGQLASTYNVYSVPTILFLKDGNLLKEQMGVLPIPAFRAHIKKILF